MNPQLLKSLALTGLLACLPAVGQNARIQFQHLDKLAAKASEVVNVTLDGNTLRMATQLMGKNPEAKEAIRNLQGVYVKAFEFDKAGEYTAADVEAIRAQLQPPAWSRIVQVQSKKDGDVDVYVLGDGKGGNLGLTVVAAEPKELVVVNIVGSIDLDKLSSLEGQLGIPKLNVHKGKATKSQGERRDEE